MTSTLQQEAGRKLRFSADRTMRSAQRLYENGHITYLRTDSTTLSESAIAAARAQARELYGDAYVPAQPRQYTRKVKNAQEAHEAIRPAGETFRTPGQIAREVDGDDFRLYELIWQRTVASQMADARGTTVSVRIGGTAATGEAVTFASSGRTITFPGFLKAYVETVDDQAGGEADDAESRLPELTQGQPLTAASLTPEGHSTNPPSRFTEPSLIKTLEDLGIGRPSTYASIIKTIQDRGYVWKKGQALVPSWIAFAVVGLLEHHFGRLVDYDFTAAMEDELDSIAAGNQGRTDWLDGFYFGGAQGSEGSIARAGGLKKLVGINLEEIDAREINSVPVFDDIVVRVGRYGPYLERVRDGVLAAGQPARRPAARRAHPRGGRAAVLGAAGGALAGGRPGDRARDRGQGGPLRARTSPSCCPTSSRRPRRNGTGTKKKAPAKPKPRTGSLFKGMTTESVTLEEALRLLSLPRLVGVDPESGAEITAQNGRYGPYLKKGTDSRSLTSEEQLFTVTLDEALADLRPAQAARSADGRGHPAAARAGHRPGDQEADGDQGRAVRPVRHRRRDQRQPAQGRRGREDHRRARRRAAGRTPGPRPGARRSRPPASRPPARRPPAKYGLEHHARAVRAGSGVSRASPRRRPGRRRPGRRRPRWRAS